MTQGNKSYWKKPINGYCLIVFISTWRCQCKLIKINWKQGRSTNNQKVESPMYCQAGDQCEVVFKPLKPIFATTFDEFIKYARCTIMDHLEMVGLAKILSVEHSTN